MVQQEPELGTVQRWLDRLDYALIYRWPHVAGPAFLAALGLAVTWGARTAADRWPATVGWLPWLVTGLAAVVLLLGLETVGRLPGQRETTWALALWLGGTSWAVVAAWLSPFTGPAVLGLGPLMWAWLLLLVVGWPPWFKHRRIRRAVEVSQEIAAWDGDAVGLPRVELVATGGGADGTSWWARLQPHRKGEYTLARLRQAVPRIAARYDVAQSAVHIEPVRDGREGEYVLRIQTAEREQPGVEWTVPEKRPSARRPFTIGKRDSGGELLGELARPGHGGVDGLAAGQKGYGKTTYSKRLALQAIAAYDALNLVADCKPGSPDYRAIGQHSYVYAITPQQVDVLVRALLIICRVRGERPRNDRMVLLFQLDETALYYAPSVPEPAPHELTDPDERRRWQSRARKDAQNTDAERWANMERLVAISRAFDVAVRLATQRGSERKLGGGAVRSAMLAGEVVGFHSPHPRDASLLSTDGDFQLSKLPRGVPGEVMLQNGQHQDVTRGRLHEVTDDTERELLDRYGAEQGDLHDDELAALRSELGSAWDELRGANRVHAVPPVTAPIPDPEPELPAAPKRQRALTADESRQLVFDTLVGFPRPVMVRAVAERVGKSEEIVRVRLKELVAEGRAEQLGIGRYLKYAAVVAPKE